MPRTASLIFGFPIAIMSLLGCQSPTLFHGDLGAVSYRAERLVTPTYPAEAIRSHRSGVAVVKLRINKAGSVDFASVLQAPDQTTAEASLAAAKSTTFHMPPITATKYVIEGKLYYYFLLSPTPHVEIPVLK